jgi:hypothetical protein
LEQELHGFGCGQPADAQHDLLELEVCDAFEAIAISICGTRKGA